jgi:hypothetical protein
MTSSCTVHVYGLVRRVVHDFEKLRDLRIGRSIGRRHSDTEELHPRRRDDAALVRRSVHLEVDDRLDADCGEVPVVRAFRLRAPVIVVVDFSEITDADTAERGGYR